MDLTKRNEHFSSSDVKSWLTTGVDEILGKYQDSFTSKIYKEDNNEYDLLMNVFGITPELKRENMQYWGRELGMCWQRIVTEVCRHHCEDFGPAVRIDRDEPCDLTVGDYAIDTKYRIGSGDAGTLKKFKAYGSLLKDKGYEPVFLLIREDSLPAALTACDHGGWSVFAGDDTYDFITDLSGFDIKDFLIEKANSFLVKRTENK